MKLWQIVGGTALSLTLAGCAQHHEAPAQQPPVNTAASPDTGPAITGPNVSGSVFINQRVALPPDAVLTVTLSDASVADAPSRVISQKVARLRVNRHRLPSSCRITRRKLPLTRVFC